MGSKTENDFLKEFESELESETYGDIISDFESELEDDDSEGGGLQFEEEDVFKMADDDASLDDMLSHMENLSGDEFDSDESVGRTMDTDDPEMGSLEELDSAVGAFDSGIEEEEPVFVEPEEPILSEEGDAQLTDILGVEEPAQEDGISLDDISEVGEPVGLEGIEGLEGLEGLEGADLGGLAQLDELVVEEPGEEAGKEKKKGSFLEKLKLIFFGEDDEEDIELSDVEVSNLDGVEVVGEGDGAEGGKKKKKKEKKEKPPKEKKEKPPKEKKEKPPKPPKPKKEKKPKEKDNTPPLPKGPVIMIWVMAASLGALVYLGTNLISYSSGVQSAKHLYDSGSYTEAYEKLTGLELKEEDQELYKKARVLASVSSEYDSYVRYLKYGRKDLALDSLICAAGRCQMNLENAQEYGCEAELKILKKKVKKELKSSFKFSMKDAMKFYNMEDRNEYTIALKKKMVKLGIIEE